MKKAKDLVPGEHILYSLFGNQREGTVVRIENYHYTMDISLTDGTIPYVRSNDKFETIPERRGSSAANRDIGRGIAGMRSRYGISSAALSRKCHVTEARLSEIERGESGTGDEIRGILSALLPDPIPVI